jgi:single-strand DNA-binding protein
MNKVVLIGRITAKPELNYAQSQMAVTKFTIAVDRGKDKGADFIRVTAFDRQAENICRYMDKGRMIAVEGRIQTGSYKGKDGKTVYTTDVIVDRSEFLGSASQSAEEIEQKAKDLFSIEDNYESTTDDMPF